MISSGAAELRCYGATLRAVPSKVGNFIVGMFPGGLDAGRALHLQLYDDVFQTYYQNIFRYSHPRVQNSVLRTLLIGNPDGPGLVAAEGVRLFLEQTAYGHPLVDPVYVYEGMEVPDPSYGEPSQVSRTIGRMLGH